MGLRPLYLAHGRDIQVSVDGPALRVRAIARAASWYPFDRLSRVVSAADVRWQSPALLRCLTAGVPVHFLDRAGHPLGCCYGVRRRETTLTGLLREAIEHPEWDRRYRTWVGGVQRQSMRKALQAHGLHCRRLDGPGVRGALANAWFDHAHCGAGQLFVQMKGLLFSWLGEQFSHSVADPRLLGFPRPGLNFAATFTDILQWSAYATLVGESVGTRDITQPSRFAAFWFQDHQPEMQVHHDELMRQFELWLRGWVL